MCNIVLHCLAEICKVFPEKGVAWMAAYATLKPLLFSTNAYASA